MDDQVDDAVGGDRRCPPDQRRWRGPIAASANSGDADHGEAQRGRGRCARSAPCGGRWWLRCQRHAGAVHHPAVGGVADALHGDEASRRRGRGHGDHVPASPARRPLPHRSPASAARRRRRTPPRGCPRSVAMPLMSSSRYIDDRRRQLGQPPSTGIMKANRWPSRSSRPAGGTGRCGTRRSSSATTADRGDERPASGRSASAARGPRCTGATRPAALRTASSVSSAHIGIDGEEHQLLDHHARRAGVTPIV